MKGDKYQFSIQYNYLFDVYPEVYYGDFWQLGFVFTKTNWYGMAIQEYMGHSEIRVLYIALFRRPPDERGFDAFLNWFLRIWWHEWGHIIGLSDNHHTAIFAHINTINLN